MTHVDGIERWSTKIRWVKCIIPQDRDMRSSSLTIPQCALSFQDLVLLVCNSFSLDGTAWWYT